MDWVLERSLTLKTLSTWIYKQKLYPRGCKLNWKKDLWVDIKCMRNFQSVRCKSFLKGNSSQLRTVNFHSFTRHNRNFNQRWCVIDKVRLRIWKTLIIRRQETPEKNKKNLKKKSTKKRVFLPLIIFVMRIFFFATNLIIFLFRMEF